MAEDTTAAASVPEAGQGAADGGRWVEVAPERLARWVATFAERHGAISVEPGRLAVTFRAADGAAAECHPPFPPLPAPAGGAWPGDPVSLAGLIAAHAAADRTVGVFLVRLGGFAAGVFTGSPPRLVSSKVGSRLVHGRSAAGGTSQHRFSRRPGRLAAAAGDEACRGPVPHSAGSEAGRAARHPAPVPRGPHPPDRPRLNRQAPEVTRPPRPPTAVPHPAAG